MTRLFFDIVSPEGPEYDHVGRYFHDLTGAYRDAEMLSLDLSCTQDRDWQGSEVQVRNVSGEKLFALPVALLAA